MISFLLSCIFLGKFNGIYVFLQIMAPVDVCKHLENTASFLHPTTFSSYIEFCIHV